MDMFTATALIKGRTNALKLLIQAKEGRFSSENTSALTVPEKITGRRNARAEKRVCFATEDTTPQAVTEETQTTQ